MVESKSDRHRSKINEHSEFLDEFAAIETNDLAVSSERLGHRRWRIGALS
jgi:hypothetical protein